MTDRRKALDLMEMEQDEERECLEGQMKQAEQVLSEIQISATTQDQLSLQVHELMEIITQARAVFSPTQELTR